MCWRKNPIKESEEKKKKGGVELSWPSTHQCLPALVPICARHQNHCIAPWRAKKTMWRTWFRFFSCAIPKMTWRILRASVLCGFFGGSVLRRNFDGDQFRHCTSIFPSRNSGFPPSYRDAKTQSIFDFPPALKLSALRPVGNLIAFFWYISSRTKVMLYVWRRFPSLKNRNQNGIKTRIIARAPQHVKRGSCFSCKCNLVSFFV